MIDQALGEAAALLDRWQEEAERHSKAIGGAVLFGGRRDELVRYIADSLVASARLGKPVRAIRPLQIDTAEEAP